MSKPEVVVFQQMLGEPSPFRAAIADVQQITDQVREEVQKLVGTQYKEFIAVTYQTQVVNGTNYYIKVKTGDDSFMLTIVVYKDLSGSIQLTKVEIPESVIVPPIGGKKQ